MVTYNLTFSKTMFCCAAVWRQQRLTPHVFAASYLCCIKSETARHSGRGSLLANTEAIGYNHCYYSSFLADWKGNCKFLRIFVNFLKPDVQKIVNFPVEWGPQGRLRRRVACKEGADMLK
ncbi:MAG: hypothetical protein ACLRVT_03670 [Oscillospiraceae bacterium]